MATVEDTSKFGLTVVTLLGRPLNDIEERYAPKRLYVKGIMEKPLPRPRVSIVGSRKASPSGLSDARTIASILVENGVVTVSGLAEGLDTSVHEETIESGGRTIAVLGTPLNKTYPQKNFKLQQKIIQYHLAISQFPTGHPTARKNFVLRNRTMALISDATIIVEARDTSGSLHQGWEALRLGRPLFIWKSILNDPRVSWPQKMLRYGAMELSDPIEVLESLPFSVEMPNIFS